MFEDSVLDGAHIRTVSAEVHLRNEHLAVFFGLHNRQAVIFFSGFCCAFSILHPRGSFLSFVYIKPKRILKIPFLLRF